MKCSIVVRNGEKFILNTRSSAALTRAGIDRSAWYTRDKTGFTFYENSLTNQLKTNKISKGVNSIRETGTQNIITH